MRIIFVLMLGVAQFVMAADDNRLTLRQAHAIALQNQPKIAAADLKALAARERVTQVRSAYFPSITANVTSVGTADQNTRIAAGGLNNPAIFDRNSEGVTINQLLTDFGRTANLSEGSKLRARAEQTNAAVTRAQVLLQVDAAYFSVLQAQAVRQVAAETVKTRELLLDRVSALASNKLRSDLDVSFARVAVGESRLLQNKAENDYRAAYATLAMWLGETNRPAYQLAEEPLPAGLNEGMSELINEALARRPELVSLRLEREAALKFARAEHALQYPTISAVGAGGIIPVRDARLRGDYAAAGVNFSFPLFAGNLYASRQKEAELTAQRAGELLRDEENNVIRDVQIAYQNVVYSQDQLKLVESLLGNAAQALTLAEARYNIGSSSIVELSQAQLNKTGAEISLATAKYDSLILVSKLRFQTGGFYETGGPASPSR